MSLFLQQPFEHGAKNTSEVSASPPLATVARVVLSSAGEIGCAPVFLSTLRSFCLHRSSSAIETTILGRWRPWDGMHGRGIARKGRVGRERTRHPKEVRYRAGNRRNEGASSQGSRPRGAKAVGLRQEVRQARVWRWWSVVFGDEQRVCWQCGREQVRSAPICLFAW